MGFVCMPHVKKLIFSPLPVILLLVALATGPSVPPQAIASTETAAQSSNGIPDPVTYRHVATIPPVGAPSGTYSGEFTSGTATNSDVNPKNLPNRPFLGTELYYLDKNPNDLERKWLADLELDFLRVEVTPDQIGVGRPADGYPDSDFSSWAAKDFENGASGWHFNQSGSSITNILNNIDVVSFPLLMMTHQGGESYMGQIPDSDQYAEYFLATVVYYNVVRGMNIKYWEVLNEPDWGWDKMPCSPDCYAAIFRRVAEKIKSYPDPRVNSIRLGGPVLGSGDPIDGSWPDGYANRDSDGGRDWRSYIPTLLAQGSRDGKYDIGFLSWHDYGDTWGLPDNMYNLDQNYVVVNRVNAFYAMLDNYANTAGERPPLAVTEMNFDAGTTQDQGQFRYKDFYAALWHTSTLNNYFSTGKVTMISHFFWRGTDDFPKGLIYKGSDSGGSPVKNPSWYAYKEYITHTQTKILAASNGKVDRWTDAIVTTDVDGKMLYLIAVNKNNQPRALDFSFDVPSSLLGTVSISKETMQKGGDGQYGTWFHKPEIDQVYQYQPVTFDAGKQVHYKETIPPLTIVYYTIVRTGS